MRIIMGILICALAVVLNSIEVDSQGQTPGEIHIRDFLSRGRSAGLRNANYPSRPPVGLATLLKTLPNGPACDASTILVKRGPFTVGWKDGTLVKYFFIRGQVVVYDHKLKCVTILDPKYYTAMGVSTNTLAPEKLPKRNSSSSSGSNLSSDSDTDVSNTFSNYPSSPSSNNGWANKRRRY